MILKARIDNARKPVLQAIEDSLIPGAVLGVINADGECEVCASGFAQKVPEKRVMLTDTWFDLASLTKVIFTTPRIIDHHLKGNLALDEPLISVLPDLQQYHSDSWIRRTTFAQCLSHQTKFPAVEPIYTYGTDPSLLRAFVLQRDWEPGPRVYSDINFILLGIALERLEEQRIRDMAVAEGLSFQVDPHVCATTEWCTWRERFLCGEVHDENCHALQGAGHAGLFGTATGVLEHAHALLNANAQSAATIDYMRTRVSTDRTYGWECKHDGWSGGSACSRETIGHTGFTGTGLWVDFSAGIAWTLLTNRIHPTRHTDTGIVQLRREVGALIAC